VRGSKGQWLWAAAAASLAVSLTPWSDFVLYPFRLFTTWIHECGHALMTVAVGGEVTSIAIEPDASGLTLSLIPDTRVARALVASSGYLGAAVVGCLLLAATRVERWARVILLGIAAFMLVTLVVWMRNVFGAVVVVAWGAALVLLAHERLGNAPRFLLSFLAIQVALNSVYDIRTLFLVDGPSDAVTMAQVFVLPAGIWAAAWMLASVAMLAATLWMTRRPRLPGL
jgi:hypothetical protein